MKKICSIGLTLISLQGLAQTAHLSGQLDSLANQQVKLRYQQGEQWLSDSVNANNGTFHFSLDPGETILASLQIEGRRYLPVVISPGEEIHISGSLTQLEQANIQGASQQGVWQEWSRQWAAITKQAGIYYRQLDSIGPKGDRTAVNEGFADLEKNTRQAVTSIVSSYPASPISALVIEDRYVNYPNLTLAAQFYAQLSPKAKATSYGRRIAEAIKLDQKTAIGSKPHFSLPDKDGKPVSLADYKGRYVLVDFWASWCVPCRKENPNVVNAYHKYHDKGLEIIGISLDNNKANWLKAVEADSLKWVHLSDLAGWKSSVVTDYGIKSIPTNFLVDKEGKVIARNLRGEALEKELEKLFYSPALSTL